MSPKAVGKAQLKVPDAVGRKLAWWYAAASYNVTTTDSWQTLRSAVVWHPKQCNAINQLDVSGWWVTGDDGKAGLLLSQFICLSESLVDPVTLVATPTSADRPTYVTAQHALVDNGNDVEMTFWTWNPDGTPAPETSFDWRCRVPYWDIIF